MTGGRKKVKSSFFLKLEEKTERGFKIYSDFVYDHVLS